MSRLAVSFGGRNPPKKNWSEGKPLATSADRSADGPGTGNTLNPSATAVRTSLKPGSATSGVPASEISSNRLALVKRLQNPRAIPVAAEVVVRLKLSADAIRGEKLSAVARIFTHNHVCGRECEERANREIAEISDGGRNNIKSARERSRAELVELPLHP